MGKEEMKCQFYILILTIISVLVFIILFSHLTFVGQNFRHHSNSRGELISVNKFRVGEEEKSEVMKKEEIKQLKVLCLIMTRDCPANKLKTNAIRETWGKRCDKLIFVQNGTYSRNETYLYAKDIIAVPMKIDDRAQLWHKIVAAFTYLYRNYLDDYDWFIKSDDDAYVILDSLKEFLFHKSSPAESIYFGYKFKPYVKQGYMSGG